LDEGKFLKIMQEWWLTISDRRGSTVILTLLAKTKKALFRASCGSRRTILMNNAHPAEVNHTKQARTRF
jgi:hypothetical protein